MKKLWFALAAVAVAVGCQRVAHEAESTSPERFYASFEQGDGTRTFVDGEGDNVRMHWTAGDKVAIFHSTYGEEYEFLGETGDTGGAFDKVPSSQFTAGFELSRNYALYPYATRLKMNEEGKVTVTLPATQTYAEDTFGLGSGLMTAVTSNSEDNHLTFKNVTGYLKLKIYGGVAVRTVTFKGNNHEKLTGTAVIDIPYGDVPAIEVTGDGEEVTLECGSVSTSEDPEAPTTFWFALPPMNFEQGFTVEVTDENGLVTTKKLSRAIEIKRNTIKPMAAFRIEGQAVFIGNIPYYLAGSVIHLHPAVIARDLRKYGHILHDEIGGASYGIELIPLLYAVCPVAEAQHPVCTVHLIGHDIVYYIHCSFPVVYLAAAAPYAVRHEQ